MLIMLLCCVLVACNDVPDDKGVRMERDLSVDTSSPIGLYFYASDGTYQRYNENIGENYFDTNKPTVAFFHGWLPEASGFKDGEICHNADEFAPKIIEAGYNFCALDYSKFAQSLPALFNYIWMGFDDSHSVACRFAREFAACFKDYDKEIRFVSHSYGAHSSTATAYLLSKMVEQGIIGANCLPSRMTYADPYLGDLFTGGMFGGIKGDTIENVGESIGARSTTEVVADCMQYLSDKGVVIDVYCGMPMAYDQFLEKETERRDAARKNSTIQAHGRFSKACKRNTVRWAIYTCSRLSGRSTRSLRTSNIRRDNISRQRRWTIKKCLRSKANFLSLR